MTGRGIVGAAVALCLSAALAGCGGGGTTVKSKADFAAATRKVCANADSGGSLKQRLTKALTEAHGASSVGAMLEAIEQGVGVTNGQLDKLEKIAPPPASAVTANEWKAATERLEDDQRAMNDALGAVSDAAAATGKVATPGSAAGKRLVRRLTQAGLLRKAAALAWMRLGRKAGLSPSCRFDFLSLGSAG